MTKKRKRIIKIVAALVVLLVFAVFIYYAFDPKPYQDYRGYKDAKIRGINIKIPENWHIEDSSDSPYIYEEVNGKHKIYFVLGESGEPELISPDIYLHPYLGRIELQNKIDVWVYTSLGQGMMRGEYVTEEGIKELYTIDYAQYDFYLLSYEAIEQETAVKIFYSIY